MVVEVKTNGSRIILHVRGTIDLKEELIEEEMVEMVIDGLVHLEQEVGVEQEL